MSIAIYPLQTRSSQVAYTLKNDKPNKQQVYFDENINNVNKRMCETEKYDERDEHSVQYLKDFLKQHDYKFDESDTTSVLCSRIFENVETINSFVKFFKGLGKTNQKSIILILAATGIIIAFQTDSIDVPNLLNQATNLKDKATPLAQNVLKILADKFFNSNQIGPQNLPVLESFNNGVVNIVNTTATNIASNVPTTGILKNLASHVVSNAPDTGIVKTLASKSSPYMFVPAFFNKDLFYRIIHWKEGEVGTVAPNEALTNGFKTANYRKFGLQTILDVLGVNKDDLSAVNNAETSLVKKLEINVPPSVGEKIEAYEKNFKASNQNEIRGDNNFLTSDDYKFKKIELASNEDFDYPENYYKDLFDNEKALENKVEELVKKEIIRQQESKAEFLDYVQKFGRDAAIKHYHEESFDVGFSPDDIKTLSTMGLTEEDGINLTDRDLILKNYEAKDKNRSILNLPKAKYPSEFYDYLSTELGYNINRFDNNIEQMPEFEYYKLAYNYGQTHKLQKNLVKDLHDDKYFKIIKDYRQKANSANETSSANELSTLPNANRTIISGLNNTATSSVNKTIATTQPNADLQTTIPETKLPAPASAPPPEKINVSTNKIIDPTSERNTIKNFFKLAKEL